MSPQIIGDKENAICDKENIGIYTDSNTLPNDESSNASSFWYKVICICAENDRVKVT